jgi:hypothetical protein
MEIGKPIKDIFVSSGAAKFFAASSAAGMFASAGEGAFRFAHDANVQDPNMFQNAGNSTGTFAGSMGSFAFDAGSLAYFGMRHGGMEHTLADGTKGVMMKGMPSALADGADWAAKKAYAGEVAGYGASRIASKLPFMGGKGMPAGFVKSMGTMKGLGLMAAPFLLEMAATKALGFAGKVLDESYQSSRQMRMMKYDNRFFDTNRYDASTYQQVGQALGNYQSKMVSMARIYHA